MQYLDGENFLSSQQNIMIWCKFWNTYYYLLSQHWITSESLVHHFTEDYCLFVIIEEWCFQYLDTFWLKCIFLFLDFNGFNFPWWQEHFLFSTRYDILFDVGLIYLLCFPEDSWPIFNYLSLSNENIFLCFYFLILIFNEGLKLVFNIGNACLNFIPRRFIIPKFSPKHV